MAASAASVGALPLPLSITPEMEAAYAAASARLQPPAIGHLRGRPVSRVNPGDHSSARRILAPFFNAVVDSEANPAFADSEKAFDVAIRS